MQNDIGGRFSQPIFPTNVNELVQRACDEAGFESAKELFRGKVYSKEKVGSVILDGTCRGEVCVLKVQLIPMNTEESAMIEAFMAQNKSPLIRAPKILAMQPWRQDVGYGFLLMEKIDAPKIFEPPLATDEQLANWGRFFSEYRKNAITNPWFDLDKEKTSAQFVAERVSKWTENCRQIGRIPAHVFEPRVKRFLEAVDRLYADVPLVFSHRHLTSSDIFCQSGGTYVIGSNLFWGYVPKGYDLTFVIWANLLGAQTWTMDQVDQDMKRWKEMYRSLSCFKDEKDFDRMFDRSLLERTIGTILADLGINDVFASGGVRQGDLHPLLEHHIRLFDHLIR